MVILNSLAKGFFTYVGKFLAIALIGFLLYHFVIEPYSKDFNYDDLFPISRLVGGGFHE